MADNGSILFKVTTDKGCEIRAISYSILVVDESKFPGNVTMVAGAYTLN
jgi:hypothetical protein